MAAEKIALLDSVSPSAREVYVEGGYSVDSFKKSITQEELVEKTNEAIGLGVRSGPVISGEAMGLALEFINVYGAGTNHVTRSTQEKTGADDRGIPIFNASHENTRSVAELTMGLTIGLLRNIPEHDRSMQSGIYSKTNGREVRGKVMGIIGHGTIGGQVAVLAEAMGMDVIAYDPYSDSRHGRTVSAKTIEEVLEAADVVTLHTPGGSEKQAIIDAAAFRRMKDDSILINAARADLVDYDALLEAVDNGEIAGAAIDVYADDNYSEPEKGQVFDHPLRGHPKILCLPHIGGSTAEAQSAIGRSVSLKSLGYIATGNTMGSVNIPNLPLGTIPSGRNRLLNVHDNHPGVMAELSGLLADAELNVVGTAQDVKGNIGYAAFDVEGDIPKPAFLAVKALESSRRTRTIAA